MTVGLLALACGAVVGCLSASSLQRISAHRLIACAGLLGLLLVRLSIAILTTSATSHADPDSLEKDAVSFFPCAIYICIAPLMAFILLACNPRTDTTQLLLYDGTVTYQLSEWHQRLIIWATICTMVVTIAWEDPASSPDLFSYVLPCAILAAVLKLWRHPLWLSLLGPVVTIVVAVAMQSATQGLHALRLPCLASALDLLVLGLAGTLAYQAREETKTQSSGLQLYSTGRAADSSVLAHVSGWTLSAKLGLALGVGVMMAVAEVGVRHTAIPGEAWSVEAQALINSAVAGLSTGVGALFVVLDPSLSQRLNALLLGVAAGVMVMLSLLDLIEPALTQYQRPGLGLSFVVGGFVLFGCLDTLLSRCDVDRLLEGMAANPSRHAATSTASGKPDRPTLTLKSALMTALALAAHNAPEGLAVGVTTMAAGQSSRALFMVVAIALHNIPEGVAVCITMLNATRRPLLSFAVATGTGLVEPMGALVSVLVLGGNMSKMWLDMTLALVGGIMLAVSFKELLPPAWHQNPQHASIGCALGACTMLAVLLGLKH